MKKISLLLTCLLLLGGCKAKEQTKYSAQSISAGFDTVISLIGYADDEAQFSQYFQTVETEFIRYNQLFDKYNSYEGINNIKTINDNAGVAPVTVDEEIIEMLNLSKQFTELSAGKFDVTMGPVLEIWHNYREDGMYQNQNGGEASIPSIEELEEAKLCTGWDKVEIDDEKNTVYLNQDCASLDVGSVAKGFTAEKVAQLLESTGLKQGILNAGGNVRVIGEKPDGSPWIAGVQIPDLNGMGGSVGTLPLSGKLSLVTSGDYQRYYIYDGKIMHHIIDPDTLFPADHSRALSIVADNSGVADICSTLLYTMTYEEGLDMIEEIKKMGYDISVIWVYGKEDEIPANVDKMHYLDYTIVTTDDLNDIFTLAK